MEKPDFREVGRLIEGVQGTKAGFLQIFDEADGQRERAKALCAALSREQAAGRLAQIPVEELKNARAGIRTGALEEAGYRTLLDLYSAKDHELMHVDGIGEKQTGRIRELLEEFLERLARRGGIRIDAEEPFPGREREISRELVFELARLRRAEQIRRDAEPMREEICAYIDRAAQAVVIRSGLRWFFSGKRAKEGTVRAIGDLLVFCRSPQYGRMRRFIGLYGEAMGMDARAAQEDFRKNGAAFYALAEKLFGAGRPEELLYSSIPAQLAARINRFEPDLSLFLGDLRAYQLFGVRYILTQGRVLLGDEMGLGKTIQAIAAMAHLQAQDPRARFLVVCPASVLINWCREIGKFSRVEAHLLHGASLEGGFSRWEERGGAAVTNYESMGKLVERIDNRMKLSLLVIDEAHYIKNPEAKRTKYIRALDEESERILMMTGTPLENRVDEMCELIGFVRPDMAAQIRESAGMRHIPAFRELLAPAYLRRRREQVLTELPALTEEEEWCAMTEEDRAAYGAEVLAGNFTGMRRVSFLQKDPSSGSKGRRLLELCEELSEEGRKVVVFSFFRETVRKAAELLASRFLKGGGADGGTPGVGDSDGRDPADGVSDGRISGGGEPVERDSDGGDSIGGNLGSGDVVGGNPVGRVTGGDDSGIDTMAFRAEKPAAEASGFFLGVITGSTPAGDRQRLIDRFADASAGAVLVCQVQAGGTGLNIQAAGAVIFCEPQIKPSLTRQAISRVYRMGQVRSVLVFHLLCENTADEAVRRILSDKQAEFDLFADESSLADAEDNLADSEWIRRVVEEERQKYLPAVTDSAANS